MSKLLRNSGLKPHLVRTYKVSRDPAFTEKVEDVVGLYLNPPTHAIVLSVDEKTLIQALERTRLPLPLRTGRAVRHTHDYKRHGVVDPLQRGRVTPYRSLRGFRSDFVGRELGENRESTLRVSVQHSVPRYTHEPSGLVTLVTVTLHQTKRG